MTSKIVNHITRQFPYELYKQGVAMDVCRCDVCGILMEPKTSMLSGKAIIPYFWCSNCAKAYYSEVCINYVKHCINSVGVQFTYEEALQRVLQEGSPTHA